MRGQTTLKAVLLAASSALLLAVPAGFADDAGSIAQFSTSAEVSDYNVDYSPIQKFSNAFVDEQRGRTKVAFEPVGQQGKAFLIGYMRYLSNVPVSTMSRNDQLAYWLNTHNMMVVDAMIGAKSRRRMSSLRGTPDAPGTMWIEKRITVEGVELSIQDIEQNIILANFADKPNAIFGLYQGTSGGPTFQEAGFSAANLDTELAAAGRDFVSSKNGVKISRGKAELPAIVGWYQDAVFGGDPAVAAKHLATLTDAGKAAELAGVTEFKTKKFSYSSDELAVRRQANTPRAGASGGRFGNGAGGGGGGFGGTGPLDTGGFGGGGGGGS